MDLPIIEAYDRARNVAAKPFRSACYAPFTSMLLDTTGIVRACCVNHAYPLGDLRQERLKDIWTGARMEEFRNALKNYDFHLGCQLCEWKISQGDFEGKNLANSTLITYKFEHLTLPAEGPLVPRHLEFHISNTCNLACATCWGEYSTIIRSKREQLPPLPKIYDEEFFADLAEFLPYLEEAQFLGGEPFLIKEHQRIWDMLIEGGLTPRCHITTNGTQYNERVERVLYSLPCSLTVSMDGATQETFEKIRINAKFDAVMANLKRFQGICKERGTGIAIMFTLSRLNWFELGDLLLMAEDMGIPVSVSQLWEPRRFSLFSMSPQALGEVVSKLEARDAELQSKLTLNAKAWTNHFHEIRDHYRHLASQAAPTGSTLTVLQPGEVDPKATESANAFKDSLTQWAPDAEAVTVVHDEEYQILAVKTDAPSSLFDASLVGKTLDDLIVAMKRAYGSRVHILDEEHRDGTIVRLVQFIKDEDGAATLVRHGTFQTQPGRPGLIVFAGKKKLDPRVDFRSRQPAATASAN